MANYETETLRLIDAIPSDNVIDGACFLANDASGTQVSHFEAAALNQGVAETLYRGKTQWVDHVTAKELASEAKLNSPMRMIEYAACLLTRASGQCPRYDAERGLARSDEETIEYLRSSIRG